MSDRNDHKQENHDEALGVGLCILEKTLDDLAVLHMSVKADSFLFVLHKGVGEHEDRREYADDRAENENGIPIMHLRPPPLYLHPRPHRQASEAQRGCGSSRRSTQAPRAFRTR